jgi:hypothetical protein
LRRQALLEVMQRQLRDIRYIIISKMEILARKAAAGTSQPFPPLSPSQREFLAQYDMNALHGAFAKALSQGDPSQLKLLLRTERSNSCCRTLLQRIPYHLMSKKAMRRCTMHGKI